MKYQNPLDFLVPKRSISPNAGGAGTINGASVVRGRSRSMLIVLNTGTMAAGATLDVKIQYLAADGVTWTDLYSLDSGVNTQVKFTQKVAADDDLTYFGWLPVAELPWDEYRAVSVAAVAAAPHNVSFICTDFPASPPSDAGETATVNAFGAIVGVGARAAALSP